jgi:hypothetical protein
LVQELARNQESQRRGILATQDALQQAVSRATQDLLAGLEAGYTSRDGQLRGQLALLDRLMPAVQTQVMLGAAFAQAAAADRCEYLSLVYQLMERLNAVAQSSANLHPER